MYKTSMNIQFVQSIFICNILALMFWGAVDTLTRIIAKKSLISLLPGRKNLLLPLYLYWVSLLAITVVPLPFSANKLPLYKEINVVPFYNIFGTVISRIRFEKHFLLWDSMENIFGNLIMFIPLGVLLPLFHPVFRTRYIALTIAVFSSVFIELTQLASRLIHNYRHVDIDDVILNTLGAAIGFFIYSKLWKSQRSSFKIIR